MNLWRVTFDSEFRSSQGSTDYTVLNPLVTVHVACEGDSIAAVSTVINKDLGCQARITKIVEATMLDASLIVEGQERYP